VAALPFGGGSTTQRAVEPISLLLNTIKEIEYRYGAIIAPVSRKTINDAAAVTQ
jgi:hypothetical protein